jgi:hypothetical protein
VTSPRPRRRRRPPTRLRPTPARRQWRGSASTWHLIEGPRVRVAGDDTPLCCSEHYVVLYGTRGVEIIQRGNYTDAEAATGDLEQIVTAEPLEASLAARQPCRAGRDPAAAGRRRTDARGVHPHPSCRSPRAANHGPQERRAPAVTVRPVDAPGPLAGLRVIDLSQALAGP